MYRLGAQPAHNNRTQRTAQVSISTPKQQSAAPSEQGPEPPAAPRKDLNLPESREEKAGVDDEYTRDECKSSETDKGWGPMTETPPYTRRPVPPPSTVSKPTPRTTAVDLHPP